MQRRSGVPVRATHPRSARQLQQEQQSQQQQLQASGASSSSPLDAAPPPPRLSARRHASFTSSSARVARALSTAPSPAHPPYPRFDSSAPMMLSIPQQDAESAMQTGAGQSLSCGSGAGAQVQCHRGSGGSGGDSPGQMQRGDAPTGGSHSSLGGQGQEHAHGGYVPGPATSASPSSNAGPHGGSSASPRGGAAGSSASSSGSSSSSAVRSSARVASRARFSTPPAGSIAAHLAQGQGQQSPLFGQSPLSPLLPPLHPGQQQQGQGQPPSGHHPLLRSHSLSSLGSGSGSGGSAHAYAQLQQARQAAQQQGGSGASSSVQLQQERGEQARNPLARPQPRSQPHPHVRDIPPIRLPPPALPLALAASASRSGGSGGTMEGDCAMHPADGFSSTDDGGGVNWALGQGSCSPGASSPLRRSPPVHDFQAVLAQRSVPLWEALDDDKIPNTDHEQQPTTVTQRLPYAATFEWCIPSFPSFLQRGGGGGGGGGGGSLASPSASVAASSSQQPQQPQQALPPHPLPVLTSPTFVSHGQAWKLVAYPAGIDGSTAAAEFMSVYLRRLAPPLGGPVPSAAAAPASSDKQQGTATTSGAAAATASAEPGSELGKVTVLSISNGGGGSGGSGAGGGTSGSAIEAPLPGPASSSSSATPPAIPAATPPPPPAAAVASGSLFVRPHFRLTLIHPSGDARANFEVDSSSVDLDFAHPPHKLYQQQSGGQQASAASPQRRPPADPSQRDVHTAFGLPRFLHHSAILSQYLDAHGSMLLRIEMLDLRSYVWSVPLALAVPPLPPQSAVGGGLSHPGQGATTYPRSYGSQPSRIPLLVSSISGAAMAHALTQQLQHTPGQTSAHSAHQFSSAFGAPQQQQQQQLTSSRGTSPRSRSVASRLPSGFSPSVAAPQPQQSHSALSLHSLASFFSGGSSQTQQQQQQQQQQQYQSAPLSSPSSGPHTPLSVISSISSSHVILCGYEFVLRLVSRHLVSPLLGCARLEDCSLLVSLHSRHHYRLREELSLKLDAELWALPARQVAPLGAGEPWASRALRMPISALLHAQASEVEWKHLGRQINQMVMEESGGRGGGGSAGSSDSSAGVAGSGTGAAPALLGSSSFPTLHASLELFSLSVVWRIPSFTSLGAGRKTSGLFRLKDLTWNVIVDPKGNGEPGYLSVYLALDKTSAACFTHGLCLCPVFLLSILHPTDPAQHLCRRFEDAHFTFERASWGCTLFVSLAVLSSGGWLSGADGALCIEVAVQSARVVRPDELCVRTKIGSGATHAQEDAELLDAMAEAVNAEQQQQQQGGAGVPPQVRIHVTPSSPALGPLGGVAPVASPTLQPQAQTQQCPAHQRGGSGSGSGSGSSSGTFSGFANSFNSPVTNESPSPPQYGYGQRSASPQSSTVTAASASPPLTPMLEYLGQDMEHEDCDSYALAVQTRRFGGGGGRGAYSWAMQSPRFEFSSSTTPHQSPSPRFHADPSAATSAHASHLLTSTTRHGYVCVVRNSAFTDPKLPQLIGYEVDEDRLMNTFLHALHCDLEYHINITGAEMMRVFRELSQMDFSAYDYLMVFILTHGVDSNTVYAADGAHLGVNELFTLFKGAHCSSLAGKPKLFFVQACRGNCVDYSAREGSGIPNLTTPAPAPPAATTQQGTSSTQSPPAPNSSPQGHLHSTRTPSPAPPSTPVVPPPAPPAPPVSVNKSVVCGSLPLGCDTPNEADFLYASSCVPGYISWTNTASGSWYITALCNVLLSYWPNMHLGDILLRVNYAVSRQNKLVERYGSVYQIAAPAFTLTKKLFFRHTSRVTRRHLPSPGGQMTHTHSVTQQSTTFQYEERQTTSASMHSHAHSHASDRILPAAATSLPSAVTTRLPPFPSVFSFAASAEENNPGSTLTSSRVCQDQP